MFMLKAMIKIVIKCLVNSWFYKRYLNNQKVIKNGKNRLDGA